MSNPYYTVSGNPSTGAQAASATMRTEFALLSSAFDLLPTLSANGGKVLAVNAGASALEAITTTGTGSGVRATSPTFTTPLLGTPTSGTLTNCTGLPVSSGISGLGSGVATLLATFSSANLKTALTDETGSGAAVFADTPTLVTPILGTPTSGTLTACTGLPISTGVSGMASGAATFLATPSSANLLSLVSDETGTSGGLVFAGSPTLTTPNIGVATATSINKVAITAPATSATLTIADGKTFTCNQTLTLTGTSGKTLTVTNSLNLTGTDATVMTFPTTSATIARTDTGQTFTGTNAFGTLTATTVNGNTITTGTGVLTIAAGKTLTANASITITGTDAKTLTVSNSLTLAGTDATVMTFPSTSATIARTDAGQTFTGTNTFGTTNFPTSSVFNATGLGIGVTPGKALDVITSGRMRYETGLGGGFWLNSSTTTDRAFFGTGNAADTVRLYAAGLGADALTVNLATGAATWAASVTGTSFIPSGSTIPTNGMYLSAANELSWAANSAKQLTLTSDGRLYGISLHNNAGAVTGTTNQYIASGTYTPTLTNTGNITSSTMTGGYATWARVGNVVRVTIKGGVRPAALGLVTLGISLPIASALTATAELYGLGTYYLGATPVGGKITTDAANDRATFTFVEPTGDPGSNQDFIVMFQYEVL